MVTEQVFNLNGLGLLFVQSVARRDYTLVQALVLLVAFVYIVVNFCVDLLYGWLDPRAVPMMQTKPSIAVAAQASRARLLPRWLRGGIRFARRWPLGAAGAAIVVMILCAIAAPLAPYHPLETDFAAQFSPPTLAHWLGTDAFGRDLLSRLIYGSRTALLVGFASAFVGATWEPSLG